MAPEDISLTTDADDIDGWDSLAHLHLVMTIEKEFGIKFPTEKIPLLNSVQEIQKNLQEAGVL